MRVFQKSLLLCLSAVLDCERVARLSLHRAHDHKGRLLPRPEFPSEHFLLQPQDPAGHRTGALQSVRLSSQVTRATCLNKCTVCRGIQCSLAAPRLEKGCWLPLSDHSEKSRLNKQCLTMGSKHESGKNVVWGLLCLRGDSSSQSTAHEALLCRSLTVPLYLETCH